MVTRSYFDRLIPKRSVGGSYTSLSSLSLPDDGETYSSGLRNIRQNYLYDRKFFTNKVVSSSSPSSPVRTNSSTTMTSESLSEQIPEPIKSSTRLSPRTQMSQSHYQSSIDLMGSSLKCDDCQTNDGLFQCCHCNQRLCIRCCNKHYRKVTIELERLHELSDRLVAKIIHTKNDLERQKNEALEQCHKWRTDTINTINKAHALIVQTIHDEYETLGKEYELFVQKEMTHINIDQNELTRMRKGNLGSVLSSSSTTDSTNSIDAIRKRIETFAKNIDETGKFIFQVKLPIFDIDDNLCVESRFGDVTRSTSASWEKGDDSSSSSSSSSLFTDIPIEQEKSSLNHFQSNEINAQLKNNHHETINTNDNIEDISEKMDEQEFDVESSLSSSSPKSEINNSNSTPYPSSRYALSVENDIELQQQQFYSPTLGNDRYDSAYGTAPSSPNNSANNHNNHSSTNEKSSKKFTYPSKNEFSSFHNNRRHTHTFHNNNYNDDNEDTYRSVQHVELKHEQDGSVEGIAIEIEQSHKTDGITERRRTCMQACGVRRRTTILSPRSPSSSNTDRLSNDQSWFYDRTNSIPSFTS